MRRIFLSECNSKNVGIVMATSIDDNVVIIVILHATAYSNPQDSRNLNLSFRTKADIRNPLCYLLMNRCHLVIYQ